MKQNKEVKQNKRRQKRKKLVGEGNNLGRRFEIATTYKMYVNGLS